MNDAEPTSTSGFKLKFTNGSDREVVKKLYRRMSEHQLMGVKELKCAIKAHSHGLAPELEMARRLGECLRSCHSHEPPGREEAEQP